MSVDIIEQMSIGRGVTAPLVRDGRGDFANFVGAQVVAASIRQILGTKAMTPKSDGELRWRPEFGSIIHGLLFMHTGAGLEDLVRHRVLEAISRWEPRVRIKSVVIQMYQTESGQTGDNAVDVRMVYDIVTGRNGGVVTTDVFQRETI